MQTRACVSVKERRRDREAREPRPGLDVSGSLGLRCRRLPFREIFTVPSARGVHGRAGWAVSLDVSPAARSPFPGVWPHKGRGADPDGPSSEVGENLEVTFWGRPLQVAGVLLTSSSPGRAP